MEKNTIIFLIGLIVGMLFSWYMLTYTENLEQIQIIRSFKPLNHLMV